jgi:hypothetical protein
MIDAASTGARYDDMPRPVINPVSAVPSFGYSIRRHRKRLGRPAHACASARTADHLDVLASGELSVDRRELTRQTDPTAHRQRLLDDIVTEHLDPLVSWTSTDPAC